MKLLIKRNKRLSYHKYSKTSCPGIDNCLYPSCITQSEIEGFRDEENTLITYCNFKCYIGSTLINPKAFTRKEWEEYQRKHVVCNHPLERDYVSEWRCYKCNAIVKSERERHKCP